MGIFKKKEELTPEEVTRIQEQVRTMTVFGDKVKEPKKNDISDLELGLAVIQTTLEPENEPSTANLNEEQMFELADYEGYDCFFKCPPARKFSRSIMRLSKSLTDNPRNYIEMAFDAVAHTPPRDRDPRGLFDRIRNR